MSETDHLVLFPPLFFEDKGDYIINKKGNHTGTSEVSQQVTTQVDSFVPADSSHVNDNLLLPPDKIGLENSIEAAKSLGGNRELSLPDRNSFPDPLPIIDGLCLPDYVVSSPKDDSKYEKTSQLKQDVSVLSTNKFKPFKFDSIVPYYERIQSLCIGININNLQDGISGIAKLLLYMIEVMGIFVTNRKEGFVNRTELLKEIKKILLFDSAYPETGEIHGELKKNDMPVFQVPQLEELGNKFSTYYGIYQELKKVAQENPTDDRVVSAVLRKLGAIVIIPKIDIAQSSFDDEGIQKAKEIIKENEIRRMNRGN